MPHATPPLLLPCSIRHFVDVIRIVSMLSDGYVDTDLTSINSMLLWVHNVSVMDGCRSCMTMHHSIVLIVYPTTSKILQLEETVLFLCAVQSRQSHRKPEGSTAAVSWNSEYCCFGWVHANSASQQHAKGSSSQDQLVLPAMSFMWPYSHAGPFLNMCRSHWVFYHWSLLFFQDFCF